MSPFTSIKVVSKRGGNCQTWQRSTLTVHWLQQRLTGPQRIVYRFAVLALLLASVKCIKKWSFSNKYKKKQTSRHTALKGTVLKKKPRTKVSMEPPDRRGAVKGQVFRVKTERFEACKASTGHFKRNGHRIPLCSSFHKHYVLYVQMNPRLFNGSN